MTPILLNNMFYLIDNIAFDELLEIASTEGLNSPKIRAKVVMQLADNIYDSSLVKRFLSKMDRGLFQVDDGFEIKNIEKIEDLDYYLAPDGKKYTCSMAYTSHVKNNGVVSNAIEKIVVDEGSQPTEHYEMKEDAIREKLEAASFLDRFLSKHNRVLTFVLDSQVEDLERYLAVVKDDLDREVKNPFLADARITDIIDGDLGTKYIENAVGRSNNMLDSLLIYPVFSAVIGKKNLSEKFSLSALESSEFVRICPVGIGDNGDLYGFVHMIKLTSPIVSKIENEIKMGLKAEEKKFASLSASEKYQMFETRLAEYYSKNYGKMLMASGSRKYVNIVECINNMSKRYAVPDIYNSQNSMILWPSHEIVIFDNRGSKTLKEQVEEVYTIQQSDNSQSHARFITDEDKSLNDQEKTNLSFYCDLKEQEPSLKFFNSLISLSSKYSFGSLTLHNQTGEIVSELPIGNSSKRGFNPKERIGDGLDIVPDSITMGGVDPLKPTKYIDDSGNEWISERARKDVLTALFGDDGDEELELSMKKK